MPELRIGDLTVEHPIVQGGMGVGISWINLVSAVMKEGGLGVLTTVECGYSDPRWSHTKTKTIANLDAQRYAIKEVRKRVPDGVLGVNVMVAQSDYQEAVKVASEEGADVIFCGSAPPLTLPELIGDNREVKLVPIVSSAKGARTLCKRWYRDYNRYPDAFVVEGPKAGGHLGFKKKGDKGFKPENDINNNPLEKLVYEVITAIELYGNIPVIAAGGLYSGADIKNIMNLGASAAQLGTRFVPTYECDVDNGFKDAYVSAKKEDIAIIRSPLGLLGRAIHNNFLDQVEQGNKKPQSCRKQCLVSCEWKLAPYCIAEALVNAAKGNLDEGYAFAGANAWRTTEIISVHDLMETLKREYEKA